MTYSLGVDLGTTFVAAAVARPVGVAMVPLGDQSVVAPAVVAVRPDGSIVTGDAAERRAVSQPALVARAVRRRLGDPEPVRLGDVSYPVTTLLAAQLRDVVARAADREGEPADRVVLAHPTTWAPARRGRFEEVARAAGVEAPTLVTDAEAAVYHAAPGRLRAGGVLAVYDLGGGGFEATIVRTRPEGPEILGTPEGIDGFGGLDVDEAILSYVDDAVGGALARLDVDDARTAVALARLRHDCVLAKENLSLDTETVVPVFLPGRHFEIRLNRTTFDQMLRSQVESTVDALSRAVRSAGLTAADVDAVLLIGGSTRIPLVMETVTREFGRPLLEGVHPVHAVALGAAALAAVPVPAVPSGWSVDPVGASTAAAGVPWFGANGADHAEAAAPVVDATPSLGADAHDGPTQVVDLPRSGAADSDTRTAPRTGDVVRRPARLLPGPVPPGPSSRRPQFPQAEFPQAEFPQAEFPAASPERARSARRPAGVGPRPAVADATGSTCARAGPASPGRGHRRHDRGHRRRGAGPRAGVRAGVDRARTGGPTGPGQQSAVATLPSRPLEGRRSSRAHSASCAHAAASRCAGGGPSPTTQRVCAATSSSPNQPRVAVSAPVIPHRAQRPAASSMICSRWSVQPPSSSWVKGTLRSAWLMMLPFGPGRRIISPVDATAIAV